MDPAPVATSELPWSRLRPLLGGILVLAAAMGIGRFAYTPILPAMQRAGHLDHAQAGLLAAANSTGYLAGAVLVFAVVRPSQHVAILRASAATVVVATVLMATTTNLLAWGAIRFLAGLAGAGVFVLAAGLVLDDLRQRGHGSRSGWLFSGVGLGIASSGIVVYAAKHALGWRGDWVALTLVSALALYPAWCWLPSPSRSAGRTPRLRASSTGVPSRPLGALLLAYFLEGLGYSVTGTFISAIAEQSPGSEGRGAIVWIVVGLAAIPATVLWTLVAARIGYVPALAAAFLLQAVGIVLPVAGGGTPAVASAALFGGTFMGITALTLTLAGSLTPDGSAGIVGTLTAAFGVGQVIGPVLAGLIADRADGFGPALVVAAAVVLVGGVAVLTVRPTQDSRNVPRPGGE
jgi:predicted MFS family arabinose efflux permease